MLVQRVTSFWASLALVGSNFVGNSWVDAERQGLTHLKKLPDWAVVDTTVAADEKAPGRIVEAGFFDEQWK